ncbi:MAG: amino acid adenylation domain-containing protein [Kofleriaceae bacterium]|nr:amino acid adenylation domain-containing protein [Kofleriaceae bacterium]
MERWLPVAVGRAVDALGRAHGTTPFMTYLAAFYVLLHRYSQQHDIAIGTPVANRGRAEIDALIGYFLNTVVLRADLTGNPSVAALLAQVRDVALGAYAHQDAPFERVVEALRVPRDSGRSPLFQVMFVHRRERDAADSGWGGELTTGPVGDGAQPDITAKFELTLFVTDHPAGVSCVMELNTDLFDTTTIERMLEHYQMVLEGMSAEPACAIGALPMLSEGERQLVLVDWNATAREYPRDMCLHELVEAQVDRSPEAVAVVFEDTELTYRELDERANQLAHHLRALGVGPEVRVGLCVRRTLEMTIGVLGILKAGGAYVPLDPNYPADRLAFMIEDAATPVVIAHSALVDRVLRSGVHVVRIDADGPTIDQQSRTRVSAGTTPANLAYVIYTSGSTGRPKGVMVEHRNVTAHAFGWGHVEQLTPADRVLQLASLSFDGSVLEMFPAWFFGATLVLRGEDVPTADELFGERYAGITVAFFTTAYWHTLVDHALPSSYRLVSFGGERVSPAHVRTWLRANTRCTTYHVYGPTECTALSTGMRLQPEHVPDGREAPIGAGLPNYQVFVLDARGMPVPIGVVGELYIGGDGVARGYLDRPELTAAKFIANPFASGRLYRTGDLVRWLPNGLLEFHGRADTQVKLRGFRIELGEIESLIAAHPAVRDAAVIPREDVPGDKRLVAYVIGREGEPPLEVDGLRTHLAASLPAYMVPSAFVVLDALPLTPNGKLDRKALPAPDLAAVMQEAYVAPRTAVEESLAEIWSELLGLDRVGVNDQFFALGGHSLLAIQALSRIRSRLGVPLTLKEFFDATTIAGLAAAIAHQPATTSATTASSRRGDRFALSHAQKRLWLVDQMTPGSSAYHIPGGRRIRGALDVEALRRAFEDVVHRHESLRTVFPSEDGLPWQQILAPERWELPLDDLSKLEDDERAALLARISSTVAYTTFDLATGPLLRTRLVRLGPMDHVVLVTMHHIVSDGWSQAIFWREVAACYAARRRGAPALLPSLALQYADFAAQQHETERLGALAHHLAYWKQHLASAPVEVALPRLAARGARGQAATLGFSLDAATTRALRALARREGATLFMVLLAAFRAVIARTTGQDDLVIGTPSAGRDRLEVEGLIGLFVDTLVLRSVVERDATFAELVRSERATFLTAYAHQDAPFDMIVDALGVDRSGVRTPLFQLWFVDESVSGASLASSVLGDDLTDEPLPTEGPIDPKFDLSVYVHDAPEAVDLGFVYDSAVFRREDIDGIARRLGTALELAARSPDRPFAEFELAPPPTDCDPRVALAMPVYPPVLEVIDELVRMAPEAPALRHGGREFTRSELWAASKRIVDALAEAGIGEGDRVMLAGPPSVGLIAGYLGILRRGACLVPLSSRLSHENAERLAGHVGARVILEVSGGTLRAFAHVPTATIDAATGAMTMPQTLAAPSTPADPAIKYIYFTSGTTGAQKGVIGNLVALGHFSAWQRSTFAELAGPVSAQLTELGFDVFLRETMFALTAGKVMALPPKDASELEPAEMMRWLERERVTAIHTVPSLARAWLDECPSDVSLRALRCIFLVGEPLDATLVNRWRARFGADTEFINLYGTTETGPAKCWYRVPHPPEPGIQPVGWPLPDTQLLAMRDAQKLAAVGEVGEIVIRSPFSTLGYFEGANQDRHGGDAPRFFINPFRTDPADRMYRTGDLGRRRADGTIEIIGRLDDQVKIRGQRIDPSGIAAALRAHPGVADAAVIASKNGDDVRLIAYVAAADAPMLTSALREYLRQTIPPYMIPSSFVFLDVLPRKANGKLDRAALPAPDPGASRDQEYVAPRTPVELLLAGIWCDLLKVERVGVHDNFFELGGHSLLAVRTVAALRKLDLTLDVRTLFATPTLETAAAAITQHEEVRVPPTLIEPGATAITPSQLPLITLTQADIDAIVASVPGGVSNIQDIYALTPLQEGMLFHHQLTASGDTYVLVRQMAFPDRALLDRYVAAIQRVIDRHDVLRTALCWEGLSTPAQVVLRTASVRVTEVTLDGAGPSAASALAAKYSARNYRMDLTRAPLIEVVVAQEPGTARWLVLFLWHHTIGDHESMTLMHEEVEQLLGDREAALPPPRPFRELVAVARFGSPAQADHERYFQSLLGDIEEPTTPFGLVDAHRDGGENDEAGLSLSQQLADALRGQARRLGVSVATLCHVAWGQVLARSSGREKVVFGTVVFGRMNTAGAESAMGLYLNTLPFRIDLDATSVVETVRRAQTTLASLMRHEHAPLALAQRCSRVASPAPLFSALLNYRHSASGSPIPGPLAAIEWLGAAEHTNYPVSLSVDDNGFSLHLSADIQKPHSAARVCAMMERALEALAETIAHAPEAPARNIDVLPRAERNRLLVEWNATARDYPRYACLHALVEQQVDRSPDAIALVFEGVELTYRELDTRANQLAHHLISLGAGPDRRISVFVERSVEMVIAILGILKAGAAYVPLETQAPADRLAFILEDASASLVVTQARLAPQLGDVSARLVRLDADAALVAAQPTTRPQTEVRAHHLAYVIYTSGSTGRPKGVQIEHRQIVNLVTGSGAVEGIVPTDRILQFSSIAFDSSVEELFTPLVHGAAMVLRGEDVPTALELFGPRFEGVTVMNMATAYWHAIASTLKARTLSPPAALRQINIGGERAVPEYLRLWHDLMPGCALNNQYGPTETTVMATSWTLDRSQLLDGGEAPIGRPMPNYTVYVLDALGELVPVGVEGELYIGGESVARGYLARPELTAEKFVDNPFGPGRLYRTGDLVRWRTDGNLEFVGRIDGQVKIRGYRIELGEIEAVFTEHPAVRGAAVVARSLDRGEKQLVAYVVLGAAVTPAELGEYARARLPDYMVPARLIVIDAIPISATGKVNKAALPDETGAALSVTRAYEPPVGEREQQLAQIWSELLGRDQVGRRDDFFELGGHSLLAMQAIARVRERVGVSLPLAALFQARTIEALARAVDELVPTAQPTGLVSLRAAVEGQPSVVCIHPFTGTVDVYQVLGELGGHARGFDAFEARGLSYGTPFADVTEMAAYYARTWVEQRGKRAVHLLGWSFGGQVAYEMRHHLAALGVEVLSTTLLDTRAPAPGPIPLEDLNSGVPAAAGFVGIEITEEMPTRSTDESLAWLAERARARGVSVDNAALAAVARVAEAHMQAMYSHVASSTDARIDYIVAADSRGHHERVAGWRRHAPNLEVHTTTGTHETMLQRPHVERLFTLLEAVWKQG